MPDFRPESCLLDNRNLHLRPLSIFVTSPTTLRLASLSAMASRDCLAPTMIWNTALGWHGFMSDEPRADVGPFLGWWSVGPSVSSRLSFPNNRASLPRSSDLAIISAGASCVSTCSSVKKLADGNSVSAKIRLPIWRLWKLNYSSDVFRSAKKTVRAKNAGEYDR